jgi:hypothetical protein
MPVFESQRAYSKFKGLENLGGTGDLARRGQTRQNWGENGRGYKKSAAVGQNSDNRADVAALSLFSRQVIKTTSQRIQYLQ